jgi:hypothetical protein
MPSTKAPSKRSATTTPTVGPSKRTPSTTKDDNKPCKLCAQETVLAAPAVKRKGEVLTSSAPGTSDGRKIGENKLLSKTNKSTKYVNLVGEMGALTGTRFSPYGGVCDGCGGRAGRTGAKYCHACAYQKGFCVHGKKILDTSGYKQTTK